MHQSIHPSFYPPFSLPSLQPFINPAVHPSFHPLHSHCFLITVHTFLLSKTSIQTYTCAYTHPFTHSFIKPLVHPSIFSITPANSHSYLHPNPSPIYPPFISCSRPFIPPFINLLILSSNSIPTSPFFFSPTPPFNYQPTPPSVKLSSHLILSFRSIEFSTYHCIQSPTLSIPQLHPSLIFSCNHPPFHIFPPSTPLTTPLFIPSYHIFVHSFTHPSIQLSINLFIPRHISLLKPPSSPLKHPPNHSSISPPTPFFNHAYAHSSIQPPPI